MKPSPAKSKLRPYDCAEFAGALASGGKMRNSTSKHAIDAKLSVSDRAIAMSASAGSVCSTPAWRGLSAPTPRSVEVNVSRPSGSVPRSSCVATDVDVRADVKLLATSCSRMPDAPLSKS